MSRSGLWAGPGRRARLLSGLGALLALGLASGVSAWLLRLDNPVLQMERLIEAWGPFAALASIGLMVVHSFVPFPAEMLPIANGMLFGPVWGTSSPGSAQCLGPASRSA